MYSCITLWGSQFHFRIQLLLINMTSICMHRTVYFHTVTVLAERFGSVYLFMSYFVTVPCVIHDKARVGVIK